MGLLTVQTATQHKNLPYGVFAAALYASAIPFPAKNLSDEEIHAFAWQGVRHLGGLEIAEELHASSVELFELRRRRRISEEEYRNQISQIWPDSKRMEHCIGVDLRRWLP